MSTIIEVNHLSKSYTIFPKPVAAYLGGMNYKKCEAFSFVPEPAEVWLLNFTTGKSIIKIK